MPHTLQLTRDLTDAGQETIEVDRADVLYSLVTSRGAKGRALDNEASPRLADIGWISFAHELPDPPGDLYFDEPIWFNFDQQLVNIYPRDLVLSGDIGFNGIRWHLIADATVTIYVYSFA